MNQYYALYERFLKPSLTPDPSELEVFDNLMDRYFEHLSRKIGKDADLIDEIVNLDPLQWLSTREFNDAKKADYLRTIARELKVSKVTHGCYETMVKSGEVYYADALPDGDYMGGDDRPRNIMIGSSAKHGASTYM